MIFVLDRIENIVGKAANPGNHNVFCLEPFFS